ncbi:MAG: hypothetical protein A3D65_02975 [Candidatus Lloydbacteria bacterium RIFCSPHIGHO2_02_FULL_50_13]|uniref:Uncharacterized protein n=1 Tax=Candidatus Lloydbacteria bacterium RIFCSPHIGHO2_02_FULL_50_13 TaxID=1798661 RepID=A0A1G2D2M4_9BACT|nr:MAG: hypothetical protein A3D65_02975 [Candidatus Lloydbacteria bacterium RIFCSPHIGHO2_02_FULL_50_13]
MRRQPIIVIPASEDVGVPRKLQVKRAYADAIESLGGVVLLIARPTEASAFRSIIKLADGLLLIGGHDINPLRYHEKDRDCVNVSNERDLLELALFRQAKKKNIPILGICRGAQIMNVALGGSLYQNLKKDIPHAVAHARYRRGGTLMQNAFATHEISIEASTLLASFTKKKCLTVNSRHRQCIKTLGRGLFVSARAQDGVIEAIELRNYPFGLGIEWHPEELGGTSSQKIFQAFIKAANAW